MNAASYLKIAILGTRGIPARYGGFETCAEELATRLVERGHEVQVYCRPHYYQQKMSEYRGVKLVHLPSLKVRFLETVTHTLFSIMHSLLAGFDLYFIFNYANSFWLPLLFFARKKVVLHTDGLEWKRAKWNYVGRIYYS